MKKDGWLLIYRTLLDKPIWKNSTPEHKSILITILLLVDHKPNEWEWNGKTFKTNPGQTVTSLNTIKEKAGRGISVQNVRSAILRFEKLLFLSQIATKEGRLITIINWDGYQSKKNKPTKGQQRGNKEPTSNKEGNNGKNKIICEFPSDFFLDEVMKKYCMEKSYTKNPGSMFEDFRNYHTAKGSKFKNWVSAWQKWCRQDVVFNKPKDVPDYDANQPTAEDLINA